MQYYRYIIFSILLLSSNVSFTQGSCHIRDSLAVKMLYNSLGVATQTGPVFSWLGIDTLYNPSAPTTYRVKTIDLNGQGLTGVVPDSIFDLDKLDYLNVLNLSNNLITDIEGRLESTNSIFSPIITAIYLDNNLFSSTNLDFFDNFLADLDSLFYFSAATAFDNNPISLNNYTWTTNNQLEVLNLNGNVFTDTLDLDTILFYNPSIIDLYIIDNYFTAIKTSAGITPVIEKLYIHGNDLENFKDIEALITNVTSLEFFGGNSVMDTSKHDLLEFNITINNNNLTHFDISNNNLTGTLPLDLFEKLVKIENLFLDNNFIDGEMPTPTSTHYIGLQYLKGLDLSNNNLSGALPLHWLLNEQVTNNIGSGGSNMALDSFFFHSNNFQHINPNLNDLFSNNLLSGFFPNRFSSLSKINATDNKLDFIDLYRIKKIFRLKQISTASYDHYIPQSGLDSTDFIYDSQDTLAIGGLKRRLAGDSVLLDAGIVITESTAAGMNYIKNRYKWERLDTMNLAGTGGSPSSPTIEFIGEMYQNGTILSPSILNTPGLSAVDVSYNMGYNAAVANMNKMHIVGLDSLKHANWLYRAQVTNDSFPLLKLYSYPKKIEVGPCFDASGRPVICQTMVVQFDPVLLASMSASEQDSLKEALMESIGAKPLEVCLCGDLELWEISDTASVLLDAFGKGTKLAATNASAKPELLSADTDYPLLTNASNSLSDSAVIQPGTGDNTSKTLVAIIDSGLDYEYTPLQSHISEGLPIDTSCISNPIWGYNFLEKSNNATDDHGHGTAVAGIVAGISKNNIVPYGSVPERLGILPLKYTNKNGKGTLFHASCAIRYAADYKRLLSNGDTARVRVINASWGFLGDPSVSLDNALKYAGKECNILVICSAGNNSASVQGIDSLRHWPSNSIFDPADTIAIDNVLGVGAVDTHNGDLLSFYSSYGNKHIDLAASGTDSTTVAGSINDFDIFHGTSFAVPQVSRVAALLFDKYPEASYYAMKYALTNGVDKLQSADSLKLKSGGRLNYANADSILNNILDRTLCSTYYTINNTETINNHNHSVNIYPNPVSNDLNIDFDATLFNSSIKLSIFNLHGQCLNVKQFAPGGSNYTLTTKDLPDGIYFLRFQFDQEYYSLKFIKI